MGRESSETGTSSYSGSRLAPMTWQLLKGVESEGTGDRRAKATTWERLFAMLSWESPKRGRPKLWSVRVGAGKKIYIQRLYPQPNSLQNEVGVKFSYFHVFELLPSSYR